mmetsp:Transcript_3710/g.12733  ORF Transcript_3710/g.12733 Transcript_3710/m.12733 type:complete len:429 (-) Transcript_3710:239-1525(-)
MESLLVERGGRRDVFERRLRGIGVPDAVGHRRRGGDDVRVELFAQALVEHVRVEEAEEPASEPWTQRDGRLVRDAHARVVQHEPLDRGSQGLELVAALREQPLEHRRLRRAEPGKRGYFFTRTAPALRDCLVRGFIQRVPHDRGLDVPGAGDDVPHVPGSEFRHLQRLRRHHAELEDFAASPPLRHPRDAVPHAYRPVLDLHDAHGAAVRIVVTVQQQRAQRRVRPVRVRVGQSGRVVVSLRQSRAAAWRRHRVDDRAQDVRAPHPGLRADRQDVVGVDPERAQHLFLDAVHVRVVHVHLIRRRNDLQPRLEREVKRRDRLRLHPLRRVHEQKRAVARGERPRHLEAEIRVPRGVHEVQQKRLPERFALLSLVAMKQRHPLRLDRDPARALHGEPIEVLLPPPRGDRARHLEESVRERRLAVVDVRDD